MNPLLRLNQCGQFVWLDHISRSLITDGHLQRLVEEDGLGGVTSNPTIFDKAIAGSTSYDAALYRALDSDRTMSNRLSPNASSSRTFSWRRMFFGLCTTPVMGRTAS